MLPTIYRGSVKDLLGPVTTGADGKAVVFEYTDAYSVFDWGRMPDALQHKGEALAVIAAELFEKLERAENWREFSKTSTALSLRRSNKVGAAFNEVGEELQNQGLRTHYLGVLPLKSGVGGAGATVETHVAPQRISREAWLFRQMVVRQVSVVKPVIGSVLGRSLPDYYETRRSPLPRLVPLEVVFRYSCPPGSSLIERVERDAGYMTSIGFPDHKVGSGEKWDFPVLELFTKLESTDRPVSLAEALAISGMSSEQLQRMLLMTVWVSGFLKALCQQVGLELADGKLEWAIDEKGGIFLVDAIGPDELRLLRNGVQLSKEFLRSHYRDTDWYKRVCEAKGQAKVQGTADWKRLVHEAPPPLSPELKEVGSQLYMALANSLTGRNWFPTAWNLDRLVEGIRNP